MRVLTLDLETFALNVPIVVPYYNITLDKRAPFIAMSTLYKIKLEVSD